MATIRFLGAAGTVTGSRFLVRTRAAQVLVDAGLFQGLKELRLRNWAPFPVAPASLDAVVLTHAHVDHSGALPLLVRGGFAKFATCTPATLDLARLLLPDAARLQEEEARYANRRGYSKHAPNARPLFDELDAVKAIGLLSPLSYGVRREIAPGIAVTFHPAGHILGSATVLLEVGEPGGGPVRRVLFSGDLGRYGRPILPDPDPAADADVMLLESTYANRDHPPSPRGALRDVVNAAVARGGALVVPAF
ncbi:MAG TPA: MBL fold metallo-hydrolase, partial [Anaeromyxobacteraceae bacterium]|nr:MBL fold metallo-hydrolase [Anaeromyxobacteraceae bacterium]